MSNQNHPEGERAGRARDFFLTDSNNCAQSIIRAFMDLDEDTEAAIIPLSWGLGGGLAGQGHICGTIVGAVMVLGAKLRHERNLPFAEASEVIQKLIEEFQAKNGSMQCREIVGEMEMENFVQICRPMVYDTSLMIEEFLAKLDQESQQDG